MAAAARWAFLPAVLRPIFPGYRLERLKLSDDLDLVMLHLLTRGAVEHKAWLVRRFGDAGVRRWIRAHKGRGLTIKQMSPWVTERTARRWQQANPYSLIWENR